MALNPWIRGTVLVSSTRRLAGMVDYLVSLIIFTAIYALFGLGLNLQWGFTGLINFGHVAFMTVGAYTTVLLSLQGVPLFLAVLIGGGVAALLGLLIGLSTLRLREDYLAIVTIGVSELVRLIALNEEWLTRGAFGLQRFPLPLATFRPTLFSRYVMIAILTAIVGLGLWRVWKSVGPKVRQSEPAALLPSTALLIGYGVAIGAAFAGVGSVARWLKLSNVLPLGVTGGLMLAALVGVGWLAVWVARRFLVQLPRAATALSLLAALGVSGFGLWLYGVGAVALYNYSENPAKNGLMLVSVILVALAFWRLEWLVNSPWGRVLKAIREDEEVAKALGKNVFWYKLQSLMLGGFLAGVAGALFAWQLSTVYPDTFAPLITFNAWTIVVLGGAGSNAGTLLGAVIFWAYTTLTRFINDIIPLDDARQGAFRIMLIGLLLMVLMIWRPQGILGKKEELTLGR